jgi:hypothetical protein
MERVYVALIKGPVEYIEGGSKFEKIEITQEDIDSFLEEGEGVETEVDAISYYLDEYISEWAQRWCVARVMTVSEFERLFDEAKEFLK